MGSQSKEKKMETEQNIPQKKKINLIKLIKKIWQVIEKILMIAIIFISLIIVTQRLSNNEKAFLGLRLFRVQTGSMIPKYQIGDVILVKEENIDKIKVGDDVTYYGTAGSMKGKLVTHQVIDIEEKEGQKVFHTKGIANNTEDPVIQGSQINGIVQSKMYILTLICSLLTNQYILYCGILLITIYVFLLFVREK